jgi:segregation and condensation protein A
MSDFSVKLDAFEGPFDVLLDLIEKRKLHINDISLSHVTDDFIEHVKTLQKYSIRNVSHFILVASTLLLIKSKSLLPNINLTQEEQSNIQDLEDRLRLLQRIRGLSAGIKNIFGRDMVFRKSDNKLPTEPLFSPEPSITLSSLHNSLRLTIQSIPIKDIIPKAIVEKVVSLEDMIGRLIERIQTSLKTSVQQFSSSEKGNKLNVIVGFLAMLELVKQGIISVNQDEHFGDIQMESQDVGVPRII